MNHFKSMFTTSTKYTFKIGLAVIIYLLISVKIGFALDFERESDKAKWIKEFFKDKKFETSEYNENEIEKEFRQNLLKDFTSQNGIEHIEPVATGISIDDPKIKKYNTSCPNKKPINLYRHWRSLGSVEQYPATEEELEDPENKFEYVLDEDICTGKLKIFEINFYNKPDASQDYLLYCNNFIRQRFMGKPVKDDYNKSSYQAKAAYLHINPDKCLYSKNLYIDSYPNKKDSISGLFRYKNAYYFYSIDTFKKASKFLISEIEITKLLQDITNSKSYYFRTKERQDD